MKIKNSLLSLGLACACGVSGLAQTSIYKQITIDGSFADWAGVTPVFTRATPASAPTDAAHYKALYLANDDSYIYIRVTLFEPFNLFTTYQNIFFDTDVNSATGWYASGLGSDFLAQNKKGYRESSTAFTVGGSAAVNQPSFAWLSRPVTSASVLATDFETRVSRTTVCTDGTPWFPSGTTTIRMILSSSTVGNVTAEWMPDTPVLYTFASAPPPLTTNLTLLDLASAPWFFDASGTDFGTDWLDPLYYDWWTSGTGLFGYTPTPAAYPSIITPLSTDPSTYYFRGHFQWNNDPANVSFVVTNYLSDGAVLYVNGVEVKRLRMPAGTVGFGTNATGTAPPTGQADVFGIPGTMLVTGDNVFGVETHQAPGSSTDMVFGLSLTAAIEFPVLIMDANLPADQTVAVGLPVTFSASLLGSGPLSYQWLFNGTNLPGATEASYAIASVQGAHAGSYALRVSNAISTNTTRTAVLRVPVAITDASLPADQTITEGNAVTLIVAADGMEPLSYQWFKGVNPILDATNATYTISAPVPANAGSYSAQVSNPVNSVNSRTAALTVIPSTTPPVVTALHGSPNVITVTFSKPMDPVTAGVPVNYALSPSATVLTATLNPLNAQEVTLTTSPLILGTVYIVSFNGVQDANGNRVAANTKMPFRASVVIDGAFADWQSLTPLYSSASNSPTATNPKDFYVFNDADYIYLMVTTWDPTVLASSQNNFFFDTDNDPITGWTNSNWGGSDLLLQGSSGYQQMNNVFNAGGINGLDYLCAPLATANQFEFRLSRHATNASDGSPAFKTNVINFKFDGELSWTTVNRVPADGTSISYTAVEPAPLPLSPLTIGCAGGQVILSWSGPGALQSCGWLSSDTWTNVPAATSPCTLPPSAAQKFFRLAQ